MKKTETEDLRMEAYYYRFEPTGNKYIDRILSAVACAGKSYHHTNCWQDETEPREAVHKGSTPVEWIQNAANEAAAELRLRRPSHEAPLEPTK